MKRVKIAVASLAFLVAIGSTYAFKVQPRTLFIQQSSTNCQAIACHEDPNDVNPATNLPEACDVSGTKYRTRSLDGQTCSDEVTTSYKQFN